jgi:pimeloyl-ACP methyl ester carboxylesterase
MVSDLGRYVEVAGHPTWVMEAGQPAGSETVLLLHGGLSNSEFLLEPLQPGLEGAFRLVAFDRRGHGRTADTPEPFHYEDMATETIAVLEDTVGGRAHLVGWSDGGIIALLVALRRPELVDRLVLIGANFHHDGLRPLNPSPEVTALLHSVYVELSPDGADHFQAIIEKSVVMFESEPELTTEQLATIQAPTLVMVGDDDLIELAHTCALYEALPAGQLSVIPATSHALPVEKPTEVSRVILQFLSAPLSVETLIPSRRASVAAAG